MTVDAQDYLGGAVVRARNDGRCDSVRRTATMHALQIACATPSADGHPDLASAGCADPAAKRWSSKRVAEHGHAGGEC